MLDVLGVVQHTEIIHTRCGHHMVVDQGNTGCIVVQRYGFCDIQSHDGSLLQK
jgi:hypothetical protein